MTKEITDQRDALPIDFGKLRALSRALAAPIAVAVLAGTILLVVIAMFALGWLLLDLISGDQKRAAEATKAALPILAAAIGLPLLIWRLKILDKQTRISDEKTQIDRETHYTSIFSRSIDQLGQTRELKFAEKIGTATETLTRTVPNIEVRLGGIHSLARLAEESRRDRSKIESTLRSYVRENSWFTREGDRYQRSTFTIKSSIRWIHDYQSGDISPEGAKSYEEWRNAVDEGRAEIEKWSASVVDTRVDVNEAIDASGEIDIPRLREPSHRFFECLFVGRKFTDKILSRATFERCTFSRCNFNSSDSTSAVEFRDCTIIDSQISLFGTAAILTSCKLINVSISIEDSKFSLQRCESIEISFDQTGDSSIETVGGFIRDIWFPSDQVKIRARRTRFSRCNFGSMNFASGSEFLRCLFPETTFEDADASDVEFASIRALNFAAANHKTKLSNSTVRPKSWPPFSPE